MSSLYKQFKRKFSLSMYKNMQIPMGGMDFFKDFVHDTRGDLYPAVEISESCAESVGENKYKISGGSAERMFCQFFPFATYEAEAESLCGEMGFVFRLPDLTASLTVDGSSLLYLCEDHREEIPLPEAFAENAAWLVSCRPGAFDVYYKVNGKAEFFITVEEPKFNESNRYASFSNGYVSLFASGEVSVTRVSSYLDNGVSIADFRPIRYEDGSVMTENGKVFFTATVRLQAGNYQAIFSWVPGTMKFEMTGALFFDCGDSFWRGWLASCLLYHRDKKQWYVWVSSFEHEHILAHGAFEGDPRFGVNLADVTLMQKADDSSEMTDFVGFKGDEDPDLIYDAATDRWLLAICRLDHETRKYIYVFFESNDPFEGFKYIGKGVEGASETGGVFVREKNDLFFVCGNDFRKRSEYRIYSKDGMQTAKFNYPDGGFRGWGCVMPLKLGSRTRYFWLTFDRHNGSDYNWSYGNIYCFEADEM